MITLLYIIKCNYGKISSLDDIAAKLLERSNGERNSWYENIVIENNFISGDFYSFRNTYIKQLNPTSNVIEKIKTEIISSISFGIDIGNNVLEYYGSSKDYARFIKNVTAKINVFNSIEPQLIDLGMFFFNMLSISPEISLLNLTISEMQLNEFLIGKYKAKVSSDVDAISLIKEYKEKITAYTLNFPLNDEQVRISITQNGAYRFDCMDKNVNHIVKILKLTQSISYA